MSKARGARESTSPAPTVNVPSGACSPPARRGRRCRAPRRGGTVAPRGRSTSTVAAEGRAHVGVRRAQRLGVVEQPLQAVERAEHLAEHVGAVDGLAGLELERGGQRDRQLVERLRDVDARRRPRRPGRSGVSIRSTRIPASLRSSTSTSLGHFRAMSGSRSASAAWTAYPVSSGSHGQSWRGHVGAQQHREGQRRCGPASPRPGRAGRGRRSGARRPRRGPRPHRRGRARRRRRWSTAWPRRSRRASPGARRGGRGRGVGAVPGTESWALDWRTRHTGGHYDVSAQVQPGEGTDVPGRTSTSTRRRASSPTSSVASTRRCTPAPRRRSRSSTPRAARPPASASRCSSTRARSSSSTSWPGTARRRSASRSSARTATAWSPATAPSTAARSACSPRTSPSSAARWARSTARRSPR